MEELLRLLLSQAQPRRDIDASWGAPGYRGPAPVATFAGRVVTPQDTLASALQRFPQGEAESGGQALGSLPQAVLASGVPLLHKLRPIPQAQMQQGMNQAKAAWEPLIPDFDTDKYMGYLLADVAHAAASETPSKMMNILRTAAWKPQGGATPITVPRKAQTAGALLTAERAGLLSEEGINNYFTSASRGDPEFASLNLKAKPENVKMMQDLLDALLGR